MSELINQYYEKKEQQERKLMCACMHGNCDDIANATYVGCDWIICFFAACMGGNLDNIRYTYIRGGSHGAEEGSHIAIRAGHEAAYDLICRLETNRLKCNIAHFMPPY